MLRAALSKAIGSGTLSFVGVHVYVVCQAIQIFNLILILQVEDC